MIVFESKRKSELANKIFFDPVTGDYEGTLKRRLECGFSWDCVPARVGLNYPLIICVAGYLDTSVGGITEPYRLRLG